MIYSQMKYWLTRRVHLFESTEDGNQTSLCGLAVSGGCYPFSTPFEWVEENFRHPYDDLNYCQSCRRKAEKLHGRKYEPLTEKYPNPMTIEVKQ